MGSKVVVYDKVIVKSRQYTEQQESVIQELQTVYGFYRPIAECMARVCNYDVNKIEEAINKKCKPAPFNLLKDIDKAVEVIVGHIKANHRIRIIGDYDADGVTSTELLLLFFRNIHVNQVDYYLPNRRVDGYGLNKNIIQKAIEDNVDLIITVDNGNSANDAIALARKAGIDVVVTDHHLPPTVVPDANAIVNPMQSDCKYPFKKLAGVGVAYKLAQALAVKMGLRLDANTVGKMYALVAIGTVCDVMPIVDENRQLVIRGLDALSKGVYPQLNMISKYMTIYALGFQIGPRINACGRLETADIALEFLEKTEGFGPLLNKVNALNETRKEIQEDCTNIAIAMVEAMPKPLPKGLVITLDSCDEGVLGLVANELTKQYHRPTIVFSKTEKGGYKGSGRSTDDIPLFEHVEPILHLIDGGGGHEGACGLNASTREQIEAFRIAFEESLKDVHIEDDNIKYVNAILDLDRFNLDTLKDQVQILFPCGNGNPTPSFLLQDVEISLETRRPGIYIVSDVYIEGKNKLTVWGHDEYPVSFRGKVNLILTFNSQGQLTINYIDFDQTLKVEMKTSEVLSW